MRATARVTAALALTLALALLLCRDVGKDFSLVKRGEAAMKARTELLDKEWVDAIPAFGSAMSSDDLNRQIHWLHMHNAAKKSSGTQPLDIVEPDGSALIPENVAAVDYMQRVVKSAYDAEAGVIAAKTRSDRSEMQRRLKAEVRLAAKTTMEEMGKDANVHITADAIRTLQKALGGKEVAHLCHRLSLPCPITSVGDAAEGDEIAGFSSSPSTAVAASPSSSPSLSPPSHGRSRGRLGRLSPDVPIRKDISDRGIRMLEEAALRPPASRTRKGHGDSRSGPNLRRIDEPVALTTAGGAEGQAGALVSRTSGQEGKARMQGLLMAHGSGGPDMPLLQPFDPPSNVYLWWGAETNKRGGGDVGSAGAGQNIRSILHLGAVEGGEWRSRHFVGEGGGFASQRLRRMSDACCATIVFPPMDWSFPIMNTDEIEAKNLRKFVANGNTLVMTGGIISKEFVNRYFAYNLEEADGGYGNGPWYKVDRGTFKAFETSPKVLPQKGISVIPMKKGSLPSGSTVLWGDEHSVAVFDIQYCEAQRRDGTGASRVLPAECEASALNGRPCSCGNIVYMGYTFPDYYPSRWGRVLLAAAEFGAADGKMRTKIGAKSAAEQRKEEEKRGFQVARRAAARAKRSERAVEKARDVGLIAKLINALSGAPVKHLAEAFETGIVAGGLEGAMPKNLAAK